MADVAKLAGVSLQTVSRVVNGRADVSALTRERVEAAMAMLDYRPNSAARALASGRASTLGVVRVHTALHGPSCTLWGIERAAHAAGYHVSVASQRWLDLDSVMDAVERLRRQGVDGIVVVGPRREAAAGLRRLRADVPLVTVEGWPDDGLPGGAAARFAGGFLAPRHLLSLGHATVWHIGGPLESIDATLRARGWRAALDGAFVPPVLQGDWSALSGYQLGREIVARAEITAVFAANDQMALGLLRRLHEAGRALAIVGYDDLPESEFFNPPLTTVRWDFAELGRRAVALVLDELAARNGVVPHATVAPTLVVRDSAR